MIIPLAPILAREFGADGLQVGLLISIYSIMQFIFAPYWGKLSDHFGRKPILLIGFLGMSLAHIWFAFSDSFTQLFLSRIVAGFFGANIVIAMAYIADVTELKERSKNLGLVGMAFGFGFTFGPALGFLFILIGNELGSAPPFGENFTALGASLLALINFIVTSFLLKDSQNTRTPLSQIFSRRSGLFSRPSLGIVWEFLKKPRLGQILFMSFILWISIAQIEPILILLVQDDFGWKKTTAYWSFAYIGLLMAFSQGFLVRKMIPFYGERMSNQVGLFLFLLGLFFMGLSVWIDFSRVLFSLAFLVAGVTLFSVGYSLSHTSLSGALSLLTPKDNQGGIFGVHQSLSSLARIVGPILGGWCYRDWSHSSPFFVAGIMGLGAFGLALWFGEKFPNIGWVSPKKTSSKEDSSFFHVDKTQIKNLIEKRIYFCFFQVEKLFLEGESQDIVSLIQPSQFKTKEDILVFLKDQDLKTPIVLLCQNGIISEEFSKNLRAKGYINAFYVKKGLIGLKEN